MSLRYFLARFPRIVAVLLGVEEAKNGNAKMKFLGHFVVRAGGALVTCQSDLGLRRVALSEFESLKAAALPQLKYNLF
jgi:hypothetical protein